MEIELKLEIAATDAEKLLGTRLFKNAVLENLTSVYFDTPTRQLRDAGFSLRVRHAGARRIQTIKADGPAAAALFVRAEWENDIEGDAPMLETPGQPLKQHIPDKVLATIVPVFRSQVSRSTQINRAATGTIELVLDRGEVVAGNRSSSVCELELELRKGGPAALFALARRIDKVVPVRLGVLSKSERGYQLAGDGAQRAVKSQPALLTADMTAEAAFQVIASACIRQFRLNEMLLGAAQGPEALHQARVGLRRLRSALSMFKPMLADAGFDDLRCGLKWIAAVLGDARNIDVLGGRFTDARVLARLQDGREQAYSQVAEALASTRLRRLMLDLTEWLAVGGWLSSPDRATLRERPVLKLAAHILDRHRKRVKRCGAALSALDDQGRHELRIEAKKLRYAAEFFGSLYTGNKEQRRTKLFHAALTELQQQLGELNDLATMPSVLDKLGIAKDAVRDASPSGTGKTKMLNKAEEAYAEMIDARRFWR